MNEDLSVSVSKRTSFSNVEKIVPKKQENGNIGCQLDLGKIKQLFLQVAIPEKQVEIMTVLKALKNRFNKNCNSIKRREIII